MGFALQNTNNVNVVEDYAAEIAVVIGTLVNVAVYKQYIVQELT